MTTWIALLRGINVGGKNVLPMASLRAGLESLGCRNVCTYIQSGNIVFNSSVKTPKALQKMIAQAIAEMHGFEPQVFVIQPKQMQEAVNANPFPEAFDDPKTLHFFFLARTPPPAANRSGLVEAQGATERFELTDHVLYLHAPDGIGRSKLAANAEKHLDVATTARNYRTVAKLLAIAEQPEYTN